MANIAECFKRDVEQFIKEKNNKRFFALSLRLAENKTTLVEQLIIGHSQIIIEEDRTQITITEVLPSLTWQI
jgi:hypothetical protein